MAYNQVLAERIRNLLPMQGVEEKKMFGGIGFMVNGKMTVSASGAKDHAMMVRIDPLVHDEVVKRNGASTAIMRGAAMKGWIFLTNDAISSDKELAYWVQLALDFNSAAKASGK